MTTIGPSRRPLPTATVSARTDVQVDARVAKVDVDTFTNVAVKAGPQLAVGVDTGTTVGVTAPLTRVDVDTKTSVGVGVTTRAVDVAVDTATLVKVKALLASVAVDSTTKVGVHAGRDALDVGVDAHTHVDVDLGWFHRSVDLGPRFHLHLALPEALFFGHQPRLTPPQPK